MYKYFHLFPRRIFVFPIHSLSSKYLDDLHNIPQPIPAMSSSGGVFSNTLQSITTTKLTELSKKRKYFEDQKGELLQAAALEPDQKRKLQILVDGVKKSFSLKTSTRKRGDRHGGAGRIIYGSTNNPRLEICR